MPRIAVIFFPLLLMMPQVSMGQIQLEGQVVSLPVKYPIPFANIGIMNGTVGTISDHDGSFSMTISDHYANDTVVFSALGFERVRIPIRNFVRQNQLTIYLKETAYRLSEIVVTADRGKAKLVYAGNPQFEGSSIYADTVNAGSAMALLVKNTGRKGKQKFEYPAFIREVQVMILNNTFGSFKIRARIYNVVMKSGKPFPGIDLLNESVVLQSTITDGWLSFDLTPYRLQVDEDFFVAFEWILEKSDRNNLFKQYETFKKQNPDKVAQNYSIVDGEKVIFDNFQGNFFFGTSFGISVSAPIIRENVCYYRLNSFGQWYPSPTVLTARAKMGNWIPDNDRMDQLEVDSSSENNLLSYYVTHPVVVFGPDSIEQEFHGENHLFTNRKTEPLEIYVSRNGNRLGFSAVNSGYYPYELNLHFSHVQNLKPLVADKQYIIYPGRQNLLVLDVVESDVENYHYELAVSEEIGDRNLKADTLFPYLIPVKKIQEQIKVQTKPTFAREDIFACHTGDTLFAMRKGRICTVPGENPDIDRIGSHGSIEILHPDGTVMVYDAIDSIQLLKGLGEMVFPGDPLGILQYSGDMNIQLLEILASEKLHTRKIHYYQEGGDPVTLKYVNYHLKDLHPQQIIMREMTDREIRRHWKDLD